MAEFVPLISEEEGNDAAWYTAAKENIPSGTLNKPDAMPAAPAVYQAASLPSSSDINGTNSAI